MTKTVDTDEVCSMLDDALAGGYDMSGFTDEDIALDLIAYADGYLDYSLDELRPAIQAWREKRRFETSSAVGS